MLNQLTVIGEGIRIALESRTRKQHGWKRHSGDAAQICQSIVSSCWNSRFFQSSTGHFRQFYARDFGLSMPSLAQLGFQKECVLTLSYALSLYKRAGRITTAISPSAVPFDFPNAYSPDSVAHIFRCLALLNARQLVEEHREFLSHEIGRFFTSVVDPDTGLPKRNTHFGGMKDYAIRDASCYDACMIAVLNNALGLLDLKNPLGSFNFKKIIKETYWRGTHFIDDISGKDIPTADANLTPFFFGIIENHGMLKAGLRAISEQGLDAPIPVRYDPDLDQTRQLWYEGLLVPGWERHAAWSNLAGMYLTILKKADRNAWKTRFTDYQHLIERHGTLFECYTHNGEPYTSRWYCADEGMLWAAGLA